MTFVYLIENIARGLLLVLEILFFLRALSSFFFFGDDNAFSEWLYSMTEPLITPVRKLCERFGWFENLPMDVPFYITMLAIVILYSVI